MFKKLKQKINEEQSPQRNAQAVQQQAQVGPGDQRSRASSLHQDDGQASATTSDRELLAGMIAEPAFLSEYTIFALDHSKRPKGAQVASANAAKSITASPKLGGNVNGNENASPQASLPVLAESLSLSLS
ncbi:golgin subfamily A member 4-like [Anguilla rostrata]|uniref:golgin subfamily A member 4-like n=1 Tax=Anguilla rostrata TaxID=7938 RepID=UPI0030CF6136